MPTLGAPLPHAENKFFDELSGAKEASHRRTLPLLHPIIFLFNLACDIKRKM